MEQLHHFIIISFILGIYTLLLKEKAIVLSFKFCLDEY